MILQGKVALVAGTSPNIGGGIAEGLAAAGAGVVAVDVRPENAADCARYINSTGGRAVGVTADVTDEAQVEAAVAAAVAAFGKIDILVNGAVIFNRKGVLDMPYAEFEQQTRIILGGAFLFTKHVAKLMIERGTRGAIINIISTAGHQGEPGNIAYSTAKAGLLNFTRSAAMELVRYGIRVNSLTPTATDRSESYDRAERWGRSVNRPNLPAGQANAFQSRVPMQRLPVPSDYGKAAAFLASEDAKMITGTDLRVDAGAIARYWAWDPSAGP
jgi:NAD(P)-dependent dehydrogenase (short-subunit alcohol dehydrogenase family)